MLAAPENANGIEWLKREVSIADQHVWYVKVDGLGVKIGGYQTDNFSVRSGLG